METNKLFNQFFQQSPNAFFLTQPSGSISDANQAACTLLGYSLTEMIELGRDRLFHINHLRQELSTRFENGSIKLEAIGIKKDGTQFPVELYTWMVKEKDGNSYYANTVLDLSHKSVNDTHLDILYRLSNDMMGVIKDNHFLKVNPAATTLLGYEEEELLYLNILNLIHPFDKKKNEEERNKILQGHDSGNFTNRIKCKNGEYKWMEWSTTFKDGFTYFIAHDVSKEIKDLERLKLLESVVEHANDAIVITEAQPFELPGPKILYVNDALLKLTGYTRDEMIGNTPRMLQGEKTDRKELDRMKNAFIKWQPVEVEVINYKKNGEAFWVNISVFPIADEKGWFTHWVSIQKDITERIMFEEALLKINRINQFSSKVNELILRAGTKEEILDNIPNIAVETGEFEFVWLNKPEIETGNLKNISYAGEEGGYIQFIQSKIAEQDIPFGNGPAGRAYRTKKCFCNNDIITEKIMVESVKSEAIKHRFKSCISNPVLINEDVEYLINIYSSERNYFNSEIIHLFENVANNIAYALNALYNKKKRKETESNNIKLTIAIEQSSSCIEITNTRGEIEYVNNAFLKLSGYRREELIGKSPSILKTGHTSNKEYQDLWKTISSGNTWKGIFCNRKKNGEYYWESAVISPVLDKEGVIINYIAVKEDITQKMAMEEEKLLLNSVIKKSNAAIILSDMNNQIVFMNDAALNMLNIPLEENVSLLKTTDLHTEETNKYIDKKANPLLLKNDEWEGEVEMQRRDGATFPAILVKKLHRNDKGNPKFKSITAINISERKSNETMLKNVNEELMALSRHLVSVREDERKQIAKDIHDELGQNLTSISIDLSWLLKHLNDDHKILTERLEQLKSVTTETISTSRRLYNSIYPQMMDDIGLVATIKWHSNSYLKNREIQINVWSNFIDIDYIGDSSVNLILFRIYQETFTNILRYAKASTVDLDINKEDDYIMMIIVDNGIGFEPDKVDTKLHHGLVGMRERINSVNGSLSIESKPGCGTTTIVKIPVL